MLFKLSLTKWNIASKTLEPQLCASLPAFHAYSGCDYTSAFVRKGKVRPLQLLEKDIKIQEAFSQLADKEEIDEETFKYMEKSSLWCCI